MAGTSVKEEARRLVEQLSEDATWEDLQHAIDVRQAIEAGPKGSRKGRTVPLVEARRRELRNWGEVEHTREKLQGLEQLYAKTAARTGENSRVRELTLRSLRGTINQLKEEIARFEARAGTSRASEEHG